MENSRKEKARGGLYFFEVGGGWRQQQQQGDDGDEREEENTNKNSLASFPFLEFANTDEDVRARVDSRSFLWEKKFALGSSVFFF